MKPSEKINELAEKIHWKGIDPYFNGGFPTAGEYINAILQFLDAEYENKKTV